MKGRPTNITSNVPAGRAAFSLIFIDFHRISLISVDFWIALWSHRLLARPEETQEWSDGPRGIVCVGRRNTTDVLRTQRERVKNRNVEVGLNTTKCT